jgi:hypothetical protein
MGMTGRDNQPKTGSREGEEDQKGETNTREWEQDAEMLHLWLIDGKGGVAHFQQLLDK